MNNEEWCKKNCPYSPDCACDGVCNFVLSLLKEQETIKGRWIPVKSPTGVEAFGIKEMTVQDVRCSVCNAEEDVSFSVYKFCPRCGAKMG